MWNGLMVNIEYASIRTTLNIRYSHIRYLYFEKNIVKNKSTYRL